MIGVFLAVLELARNYGVMVEQVGIHGKMILRPGDQFVPRMEINEVFDVTDSSGEDVQPVAVTKPR